MSFLTFIRAEHNFGNISIQLPQHSVGDKQGIFNNRDSDEIGLKILNHFSEVSHHICRLWGNIAIFPAKGFNDGKMDLFLVGVSRRAGCIKGAV